MSFIINRWVRGKDFFGRTRLLEQVKARLGKPTWVMGNRRVGKSSLLRQIQHLCQQGAWGEWIPLYWDLQGAGCGEGLKTSFLECLEDNDAVLDALGLDVDELEDANLKDLLNKFRRKAKGLKDQYILLLIDECEELVDVTAKEPGILAPFRKLTQGDFPFGVIMAGSWRMMDLDESDSITSPFLPDFLPPLLLSPFEEEESVQLLSTHGLDAELAVQIHRLCLGNPHLLQVLGEHTRRTNSLELALAELKLNKVAHYFFQSNFNCLPPGPRPWFAAQQACTKLQTLSPQDPHFPQVLQSALVSLDEGGLKVSPLLYLVEKDMEPLEVLALMAGTLTVASTNPPPPATGTVAAASSVVETPVLPSSTVEPGSGKNRLPQALARIIEMLGRQRHWPGLLERLTEDACVGHPAYEDLSCLVEARLNAGDLHRVLDLASPEFLRSEVCDERTAVYWVGLFWYQMLCRQSPFREKADPWDRLDALSRSDIPITEAFRLEAGLDGKPAMVLMRCLRSNPNQRYQTLSSLATDLAALD